MALNGAKYCSPCKWKHLMENKKKYSKKKPEAYENRGWEGRMRVATEKRASYIAEYFISTGVLLKW